MEHRRKLLLVITAGLIIRSVLAPFSTGSDIPQFRGFATTFLEHGLCFYNNAMNQEGDPWPYNWPYVYGPIWMYILGFLAHLFNGGVDFYWSNGHYFVYVDPTWIMAVKAVMIIADTLNALLIYKITLRRHYYPILSAAAYYLNPATIYLSSIYGMFDQLPLTLLLLSIYEFSWNKAGILLGLASSIKETTLPSSISLMVLSVREREFLAYLKYWILGVLLPFIPILLVCPSSLVGLYHALTSVSGPGYTFPVSYSFNGISSIATYIHQSKGEDTLIAIRIWILLFVVLTVIVGLIVYRYGPDPVTTMLLGYLVFVATYWRVNYQYLIPLTGLIVVSLVNMSLKEKIAGILVVGWIGVWPIIFPTSWWFHVHIAEPNLRMIRVIDHFTLMVFDDRIYVAYSLILTFLEYLLLGIIGIRLKKNKG